MRLERDYKINRERYGQGKFTALRIAVAMNLGPAFRPALLLAPRSQRSTWNLRAAR